MGIISSHYWTCCRTFWSSIILMHPIIHFLNYSVDIQINKCNVSGTCNKWDWNLKNNITLRKWVYKERLEHQFWRMQGRERKRCKRRPYPQNQWQKKQTTYKKNHTTPRFLTIHSRNPFSFSVKKQKGRKLKGNVNKTTLFFNYCQVPRCLNEEFHVHMNYFCALAYLKKSKWDCSI